MLVGVVLLGSANPVQLNVATDSLKIHLTLSQRALRILAMRFVHHGEEAATAANKTVAGVAVDEQKVLDARRTIFGGGVVRAQT